MCFLCSGFWTSKNESLAQNLVGEFVKTVLIALLAFAVMQYAKHVLEVYEKRRALVAFQNKTIEGVIEQLQATFLQRFGCVASPGRFETQECGNGLELYRVELDTQDDLVSSVLGKPVPALKSLASSIDSLVLAHGQEQTTESLRVVASTAKASFRQAIEDLAKEIR